MRWLGCLPKSFACNQQTGRSWNLEGQGTTESRGAAGVLTHSIGVQRVHATSQQPWSLSP